MFRSNPVQPRGATYQATSHSDPAATRKPAVGAVPLTALSVAGPTSARGNTVGGVVHAFHGAGPLRSKRRCGQGVDNPTSTLARGSTAPRARARPGTLGRLRKREPSARGARGACPSQERALSPGSARALPPLARKRALSPGARAPQPGQCLSLETPGVAQLALRRRNDGKSRISESPGSSGGAGSAAPLRARPMAGSS